MEGFRTRGQTAAVAAVARMVRGPAPHAVLLVGPAGVGKTTLALDLAAGLLCTAEPPARPCRACRGCRLAEHGTHPDLHRIGPTGPGRQVVIGGSPTRGRGVRDLIGELSLLPVEGGARVAIIDGADRMNEDAQAALLKTLEEPPAGVTIVLCADEEARLLPTVRSRCIRVRLGLVRPREIEAILADHGLADPPTAARLGRLAGGRPGVALAYARSPEAMRIRDELARTALDLTDARPSARLAAARAATPRAMALVTALDRPDPTGPSGTGPVRGRRRAAPGVVVAASGAPDRAETAENDTVVDAAAAESGTTGSDGETPDGPRTAPASDRRRGVERLLGIWLDVARDLVLAASGGARSVHDTALLDELAAISAALPAGSAERSMARLADATELLAANVSPELVLDSVVLAWPSRRSAA